MGVTPEELIANNGHLVALIDFTGQVYVGVLHYEPTTDPQFPIQLWADSCCFITFIAPDDVETFIPNPHIPPIPGPPCLIKVPCCAECMPATMLLDITNTGQFCTCLANEAYLLEWNALTQRYEFDYPGICDCATFHAELMCSEGKWIVYMALKNAMGATCADGSHLNFPLDCASMKGSAAVEFGQTGTCACGPCANDMLIVAFSPLII